MNFTNRARQELRSAGDWLAANGKPTESPDGSVDKVAILNPRRIVLFGGASEIGLAIAKRFAVPGYSHVVLAGRAESQHKTEALAELKRAAIEASWLDFDATDLASHPDLVAQIFAQRTELVIIAFGLLAPRQVWQDHEKLCALAQTNFTGALSIGSLVAKQLASQGGGQLIVLSSVAGERVRLANFSYGATKAGMDGFFTQLGNELADQQVKVLVVRPGAVRGRMLGARKVAFSTTPRRVAKACWLAVDQGKSMVRVPKVFDFLMLIFRHLPKRATTRLG